MQHISIDDDGASGVGQVAQIILTCAFMISRQKAATEAAFITTLSESSNVRRLEVDLDVPPTAGIENLLQATRELVHSSATATSNIKHNVEKRQVVELARKDGHWDLMADLLTSHSENLNDTFLRIFSQVTSMGPSATIFQLRTTSEPDIKWLLNHSAHSIPPPNPTTGVEMFRQIALLNQDKVAIEAWDGQLTFSELDKQSTRQASTLIQRGITPSTVVPLIFQFSKWVPVSLLAVWKAGASWVFLDPDHPTGRLKALVERMRAPLIITQSHLETQLQDLDTEVFLADDESIDSEPEPSLPAHLATPHNVAFLIFTSGSTGEPKAVAHTHLAFCSGVLYQAENLGITEETRTLQNCPLIFAAAPVELLFTLLRGGCVCIPTQEERIRDMASCASRLQSNAIIMSASSAAIRDPKILASRHNVIVGAEPLSADTAEKWAALHDFRHAYGASETNTVNTASLISESPTQKSVGKGSAHRFWIVDASNYNALVPPGWLGEVVVEGHALASGYMGNEEATAKAFVATPIWHHAMELGDQMPTRFYRTGDLGRVTVNGTLEIHGRTDPLQVKLRGQRVELGEIEAATSKTLMASIPLAAELILPKGQDRPSIAMFLVAPHLVENLDASLLSEHVSLSEVQQQQLDLLKKRLKDSWADLLPEYMVPTYVVPLADMPRTATGKLNRRTLRAWSAEYRSTQLMPFAMFSSSVSLDRPLTGDQELQLASVVAKLLRIPLDTLNANSGFTLLGGDSLAAIQASHELRMHDLIVSPSEIIRSENLASLATHMSSESGARDLSNGAANGEDDWISSFVDKEALLQDLGIPYDNVSDTLFTTDSQSRSIELGTGPEDCFVFHFVLKFEQGLDLASLRSALQRLVDRHDTLRTLFTQRDGRILQIVLKQMLCPIELLDLSETNMIDETISEISRSKISLDQVPTQFWILSKNKTPAALVMRLSHAQFDGISMHSIWESLAECYTQTQPEPAPAFATYARTVLHKDSSPELAYFRDLLHGVPFTDLVQRPQSGHFPQNRSLERCIKLRPVPGFTMANLFEAAWGYVCAKSSNAQAAVFDTIVSGRQIRLPPGFDARKLVGACLNDVPVVVKFHKGQTVHQLLAQIRDEHDASAKHETLGFRNILGECKPADWPQNARMTSSVQYRGFEGDTKIQIGDTECAISVLERSMDLEDLTVLVTPSEDRASGEFYIEFLYSDKVVKEAQAEKWFEDLIRSVKMLSRESVLHRDVTEILGPLER